MPPHDTPLPPPTLAPVWLGLLAAYRPADRQELLFVRLTALAVAVVLGLGRQVPTRWLVTLGAAAQDWTGWYRLFSRDRLHLATLQGTLLAQVLAAVPATEPVVPVAVDATQLPRASGKLPGCGSTRALRGLRGPRGLTFAQRDVGLSALMPRSAEGDSRAIPLRWLLLRTAKPRPLGDEPERTEAEGARDLIGWVRRQLDGGHRATQRLLVRATGRSSPRRSTAQPAGGGYRATANGDRRPSRRCTGRRGGSRSWSGCGAAPSP